MGLGARVLGGGCLVWGLVIGGVACGRPEEETELPRAEAPDPARVGGPASVYWRDDPTLPSEEIERGRRDPGWRSYAERDLSERLGDAARPGALPPLDSPQDSLASEIGPDSLPPESWEELGSARVTPGRIRLPLGESTRERSVEGPSVLAVQVLLDRGRFSPGVIDGRWGKNTEKAVYWFQYAEGLPATGTVDRATLERLALAAGVGEEALVRPHRLTAVEVEGPFVEIPEDVYERAELDCLCYQSLEEKLAELFHTTPEVLARLNPTVELGTVGEGSELMIPAVAGPVPSDESADVVRLVVSGGGHYLHALDAAGQILYHFPSTLGSEYSPSPSGDYRVTAVAFDPEWHYQPELLEGEPDDAEAAVLPAGPNSAVGTVWVALSKPHFGIHGTNAPETIGYATSSGCVRLTNWDARFLAERVGMGVAVEFRDHGRAD